MKMYVSWLAAAMAVLSVSLPAKAAPPHGKGNPGGGNTGKGGGVHVEIEVGDLVYAGITAALARQYAHDFGLKRYGTLPPGIRKNLARGKPLPPGIAKKMLPESFLARLPHHPGYEWRAAGADLILVSVATAVIADILYDVFN